MHENPFQSTEQITKPNPNDWVKGSFGDLTVPESSPKQKSPQSSTVPWKTAIPAGDAGVELPIGVAISSITKHESLSGIRNFFGRVKQAIAGIWRKFLGIFFEFEKPYVEVSDPSAAEKQPERTRHSIPFGKMLGKGGEAFVYRTNVQGELKALKIFRSPKDEIYNAADAEKARVRLKEYPEKLAEFPELPPRVVGPEKIAYDRRGKLFGYTMDLVENSYPLTKLLIPDERKKLGISLNEVMEIFMDLHDTLRDLHSRGIYIGDFRPENVLCNSSATYIVDAESMQFGRWKCHNYTVGWVDPLICKQGEKITIREKEVNADSDWFAFTSMFLQALTGCPPYGGTLIKDGKLIDIEERPLRRLSVFEKGAILPPFALPFDRLSPALRKEFADWFGPSDKRGEFPKHLLEETFWFPCPNCREEYCGEKCSCGYCAPESTAVRASTFSMPVEKIQIPPGRTILNLDNSKGTPRYLAFDKASKSLVREDGSVVGELSDANRVDRYIRMENNTALVKGASCIIVHENDQRTKFEGVSKGLFDEPVIDGNDTSLFFVAHRQLVRLKNGEFKNPDYTSVVIDKGRASIWMGPKKGVLLVDDVRSPMRVFLIDGVSQKQIENFPEIHGKLTGAETYFSEGSTWLVVHTMEHTRPLRYLFLLDNKDRTLRAWTKVSDLEVPPWMESLGGKAAYEERGVPYLVAATPSGLYRVRPRGERIIEDGVAAETILPANADFIVTNGKIQIFENEKEIEKKPEPIKIPDPISIPAAVTTEFNPQNPFAVDADIFGADFHNKLKELNDKSEQNQNVLGG